MKKVLFIVFCILSIGYSQAQNDSINYIYDERGFVVKQGTFSIGKNKFCYYGLYTSDEKACVKMFRPAHPYVLMICVAPGTEKILPNACSGIGLVGIPRSVKYISKEAFPTDVTDIYVYDDKQIENHKTIE